MKSDSLLKFCTHTHTHTHTHTLHTGVWSNDSLSTGQGVGKTVLGDMSGLIGLNVGVGVTYVPDHV